MSVTPEQSARDAHATFARSQLAEVLGRTTFGKGLTLSAGPVADAYVAATDPVMLLNGPRGSAKTTTDYRKLIVEATRSAPYPLGHPKAGVRFYAPGVMRPKYKGLWNTTIRSWWKFFPVEAFPDWTGASGRDADHRIRWRDAFGEVELLVQFRAFAEGAEEEDMRGTEYSDCMLDEMDTHPEEVITNLSGSVGRNPPRLYMRRGGRFFGSCNAPDVMTWVYRDFWESPKPGYRLFRQPGGLEPGAENRTFMGDAYYRDMVTVNAHRPWYIRKMVHNRPGYSRDMDVIFPDFDDVLHRSDTPVEVMRELPVVIGFDGGSTPAAAFCQFPQDGTMRVLAEVALERGDEFSLADACNAVMAQPRFQGAEFIGVCDPAMDAGADLPGGSMRGRLARALGIRIEVCRTNEPEARHGFVRAFLKQTRGGRPGFLLDPVCKVLRRGLNQTFHYRETHGTGDRGGVVKNKDSHVCEAMEYAASLSGSALALKRQSVRRQEREARRRQAGGGDGRWNPNTGRRDGWSVHGRAAR